MGNRSIAENCALLVRGHARERAGLHSYMRTFSCTHARPHTHTLRVHAHRPVDALKQVRLMRLIRLTKMSRIWERMQITNLVISVQPIDRMHNPGVGRCTTPALAGTMVQNSAVVCDARHGEYGAAIGP